MALPMDERLESLERFERSLHARLAKKDGKFPDVDELMTQYRAACEAVILRDFHSATSKKVEGRLWDSHGRVNARFRQELARFRGEDEKKRPVEKRKMAKHYLEFIKASQRFYRGHILRLSKEFGGIPELQEVAQKFKEPGEYSPQGSRSMESDCTGLASNGAETVSQDTRRLVLLSCHQTLIRLGDLSRYRETELNTKERNWGPAIGYYDLAGAIRPSSGLSHNQLAVIALADGNHLRATYHLYRALAVAEPHPTARNNLEIEFKKILAAWHKGELVAKGANADGTANKALLAWFVRLHARCYRGEDFAEHDELESEVLSQLAVDLKERSMETTLSKVVLINIAAEFYALVRLQNNQNSSESYQAYLHFLRLNVKTFFTLLQILLPELERLVVDDDTQIETGHQKVTAVMRRILPALRHYSSWLLSNSVVLVSELVDGALKVQVKELWRVYATSLTLLAATFPATELPLAEYLLEEDEDTLGFSPFNPEKCGRRYFLEGNEKQKSHDVGVKRLHPNEEMLSRIRDFLTDGLELTMDMKVPIALVDGTTFTCEEEGIPSESLASPGGRSRQVDVSGIEVGAGEEGSRNAGLIRLNGNKPDAIVTETDNSNEAKIDDTQSVDTSESTTASMSAAMNHMVDDLVGEAPQTPSGAQAPPIPSDSPSYEQLGPLTARDLLARVHTYSQEQRELKANTRTYAPSPTTAQHTPRPSLPSIMNTPFAAQPASPVSGSPFVRQGQGSSSRPSTARGDNSPLDTVPSSFYTPPPPQPQLQPPYQYQYASRPSTNTTHIPSPPAALPSPNRWSHPMDTPAHRGQPHAHSNSLFTSSGPYAINANDFHSSSSALFGNSSALNVGAEVQPRSGDAQAAPGAGRDGGFDPAVGGRSGNTSRRQSGLGMGR
ncbi:MAG: hypothetical protein M4579_001797 [Chaenotheca gracillima]|nr:MAG: hypothetical protein M4579_001797 [Chaenotheca gracillima]